MNKIEIKKILARNRYAKRPEEVSPRQWSAIKRAMHDKYMREWMATPAGLYTDRQIWEQTFKSLLD